MNITWIDAIFFAVLVYFFLKGWAQGFLYLATSIITFGFSLVVALRLTAPVAHLLSHYGGMSELWSGIAAYFLVACVAQAAISYVLSGLLMKAPHRLSTSSTNRFIGSLVSGLSGIFLLGIFLFFVLLIPVRGSMKEAIRDSTIAPVVIAFIDDYGGPLPRVLSDSARRLTEFLTIEPDSKDRLPLRISVDEKRLIIDEQGELALLELVNQERKKANIEPLTISFAMREVAREYSVTMMKGKYFSHIDAEGNDAGDRLSSAGVSYFLAGENLAYAPDVETAHNGLMKSEGHKKNILDPQFRRIGIGIIDAGIWGKMITQMFAD